MQRGRTGLYLILGVAVLFTVYLALAGGHSDAARTMVAPGSEARIGRISSGEAVELRDYVLNEGLTVVEFSAEWCGACRRLAPRVESLVEGRGDAILRVVDIGGWDSPVAAQFGIRAVPHLLLYENGEVVARGTDTVLSRLRE